MAEPLWRGPTEPAHADRAVPISWLDGFYVDCLAGTEVEVWRAGDRPVPPTRQQVIEAITEAITEHVWAHGTGEIDGDGLNEAADAVMALLSGDPTEPEETT